MTFRLDEYSAVTSPQRRIGILRAQIEEANDGHPADFEGWRERTHAAVRAVMGRSHPTMDRLENVSYTVGFWFDGMPDSAAEEARVDGVRQASLFSRGRSTKSPSAFQMSPRWRSRACIRG